MQLRKFYITWRFAEAELGLIFLPRLFLDNPLLGEPSTMLSEVISASLDILAEVPGRLWQVVPGREVIFSTGSTPIGNQLNMARYYYTSSNINVYIYIYLCKIIYIYIRYRYSLY